MENEDVAFANGAEVIVKFETFTHVLDIFAGSAEDGSTVALYQADVFTGSEELLHTVVWLFLKESDVALLNELMTLVNGAVALEKGAVPLYSAVVAL